MREGSARSGSTRASGGCLHQTMTIDRIEPGRAEIARAAEHAFDVVTEGGQCGCDIRRGERCPGCEPVDWSRASAGLPRNQYINAGRRKRHESTAVAFAEYLIVIVHRSHADHAWISRWIAWHARHAVIADSGHQMQAELLGLGDGELHQAIGRTTQAYIDGADGVGGQPVQRF